MHSGLGVGMRMRCCINGKFKNGTISKISSDYEGLYSIYIVGDDWGREIKRTNSQTNFILDVIYHAVRAMTDEQLKNVLTGRQCCFCPKQAAFSVGTLH
jgi:hypothetical protein